MQASRRAVLERGVPRREPVPFPEPEEADHPVHIEEEQGFSVSKGVLRVF